MYLKRLDVFGFKSFAEKTNLVFGPGITAVVGPNGSGKSNVADAVRWVLGEQSAKTLRGAKMEDVIFAGSDSKRALGYAQVTLVLDNTDGTLPLPHAEVSVARRVDRAGNSDYLLNGQSVRLKDVQEMFLDTGVGKENYSIIGQGRIDEILSTRPEERRGLFEEAAGIARYKSRRREAARRLEETEQNLLRVDDIVRELTSQMDTLAEQARVATIYQGLQTELTDLEVGLLARTLALSQSKLEEAQGRATEIAARLERLNEEQTQGEERLETTRNLAQSLEQEWQLAVTQANEAAAHVQRLESRLEMQRQAVAGAEGDNRRAQVQAEERRQRIASMLTEMQEIAHAETALAERLGGLKADLDDQELAAARRRAAFAGEQRAMEDRRTRLQTVMQRLAERQAAAQNLGQAALESSTQAEALAAQVTLLAGETGVADDVLDSRRAEVAAARNEATERQADLGRKRQATLHAREAQEKGQRELGEVREELRSIQSRLNTIEELAREFEGYQRGTRAVLLAREKGLPFSGEIEGAVGELVRTVDPKYEQAIEIALGGGIQNIVTASEQGAKQAIEYLKRTGNGRATFLPLGVVRGNEFSAQDLRELQGPGIIGPALDLVQVEARYRPAVANLIGRVVVATDMDAALALGRKTGMRFRIVTLDGELLSPGGALTGGSVGGKGNGLLSRERQREELGQRLAELQAREQSLTASLQLLRTRVAEAQQAEALADEALRAAEQAAERVGTQLARLEEQMTSLQQRLDGLRQQRATALQRAEQQAKEVQRAEQEVEELLAQKENLERELQRLQAQLVDQRTQEETAATVMTEQKVQIAGLEQQRLDLQNRIGRLQENSRQEQTALDDAIQALKLAGLSREQALRQVDALEDDLISARERAEAARVGRDALATRRAEVLEKAQEGERELRAVRRALGEAQRHEGDAAVALAQAQAEWQGTEQRLLEQYGLIPEQVAGRALADDMLTIARQRVAALKEEITALGPVNLAAIADYQQAQERLAFLTEQQGDLNEAKASLYRAIDELDKVIRTQFLASFNEIRGHFQQVFGELFEGGKADLELMNPEDLLDTGIEIIAQPPGKKPQSLNLLSGGERAMVATALLFALLRVRPSPFVILDEVEAALDEANVMRFGKYLRRFAENTQFVCITHQRGTMEVADALYGVTMEGNGVSRVVSVRLAEADLYSGTTAAASR